MKSAPHVKVRIRGNTYTPLRHPKTEDIFLRKDGGDYRDKTSWLRFPTDLTPGEIEVFNTACKAAIETEKRENEKAKVPWFTTDDKESAKWGCLPWILVIVGAGLVTTPFLLLGIILICAGAGMGGYGLAKRK